MYRPDDFTGFTGVVKNATGRPLTATDWNAFTERLIAFAKYKSKGDIIGTFVQVEYDQELEAETIFNPVVNGLNVLSEFITEDIPSTVNKGDNIFADNIQALKKALNSIT
jgi:hypothetical protein